MRVTKRKKLFNNSTPPNSIVIKSSFFFPPPVFWLYSLGSALIRFPWLESGTWESHRPCWLIWWQKKNWNTKRRKERERDTIFSLFFISIPSFSLFVLFLKRSNLQTLVERQMGNTASVASASFCQRREYSWVFLLAIPFIFCTVVYTHIYIISSVMYCMAFIWDLL